MVNFLETFKKELIKAYEETPRLNQNLTFLREKISKSNAPALLIGLPALKGVSFLTKSLDVLIKEISGPILYKINNYHDFINFSDKFTLDLANKIKLPQFYGGKPEKDDLFLKNIKDSCIPLTNTEKAIYDIENKFIPSYFACINSKKEEAIRDDHLQKLMNLKCELEKKIAFYDPVISHTVSYDVRNSECLLKNKELICQIDVQFLVSFFALNEKNKKKRFFNYKCIFKFKKEKEYFILDDVFFESIFN